MDNTSLLAKARERYRQEGATALAKGGVNAADFSRIPGLSSVISRTYESVMINSDELKEAYSSRWWELPEDLDGLYPDLDKEIVPLQSEAVAYKYSPRYRFKQPFVAEVPNVTLTGADAVAFTQDGRCILDILNSRTNFQHMRLGGAIKKAITDAPVSVGRALYKRRQPHPTRSESVAAVLLNYWGPNYYHWTLEELLKIRGINRYEYITGTDVTIVIPENPPAFVTESLAMFGYGEGDYVEWPESGEPLHVDRLVVPSFPELTPMAVTWLRRKMTGRTDPPASGSPNWVYVSRQNTTMRRVVNYAEVEAVLDRYGVRPIQCEELTLNEEIELFRSVNGVIGPHGAGLTAAVWGSDVHLVELFNDVVQSPYYVLAHVLGFDYSAVIGEPAGNASEARNKNIKIDTGKLEAVFERLSV